MPPGASGERAARRRRAIDDSTRPTATRHARDAAVCDAGVERAAAPVRDGSDDARQQRREEPELERRADSIDARSGPLWSRTITSWIIVSSRCVLGSSNGMRAFSARKTTKSAAATRTSDPADAPSRRGQRRRFAVSDRLPCRARARRAPAAAPARRARRTPSRGSRPCPRRRTPCRAPASDRGEARQREQVDEQDEVAAGTRAGAARRRAGTSSDAATTRGEADDGPGAEDPGRASGCRPRPCAGACAGPGRPAAAAARVVPRRSPSSVDDARAGGATSASDAGVRGARRSHHRASPRASTQQREQRRRRCRGRRAGRCPCCEPAQESAEPGDAREDGRVQPLAAERRRLAREAKATRRGRRRRRVAPPLVSHAAPRRRASSGLGEGRGGVLHARAGAAYPQSQVPTLVDTASGSSRRAAARRSERTSADGADGARDAHLPRAAQRRRRQGAPTSRSSSPRAARRAGAERGERSAARAHAEDQAGRRQHGHHGAQVSWATSRAREAPSLRGSPRKRDPQQAHEAGRGERPDQGEPARSPRDRRTATRRRPRPRLRKADEVDQELARRSR